MNEASVLSDKSRPKESYASMIADEKSGRATDCIKCGKCEKTCPQKLPIRELLEKQKAYSAKR